MHVNNFFEIFLIIFIYFLFFQFYKYCLIFFLVEFFLTIFFLFSFCTLTSMGLLAFSFIYIHTHQLLFYFLLNHINYYGNSKTRLASAHSFGLFFKLTTTLFIDSIQPHEFYFYFLN